MRRCLRRNDRRVDVATVVVVVVVLALSLTALRLFCAPWRARSIAVPKPNAICYEHRICAVRLTHLTSTDAWPPERANGTEWI